MSENNPVQFEKRTGKVIIHGFTKNNEEFAKTILAVEQDLNNKVTVEIYRKYKVAIRFHL